MIMTVTGPVTREELGTVLMHEHIRCVSNDMLACFGGDWLDGDALRRDSVACFALLWEEIGPFAFVDGTPMDLGRDVRLLEAVSRESGVPIVASTGLYYFPSCLTAKRTAEDIARLMLRECREGMEGTGIRPGILKCAVDAEGITPDIRKRLAAAAMVQRETGLPLYAHCRHLRDDAHRMLDIFAEHGADPAKVVLGHASSRPEADYLASLADRGCSLCIDQVFPGGEARNAAAVADLVRRGHGDRLMFSLDHPIYNEFEAADRLGPEQTPRQHADRFAFLFRSMLPAFRAAGVEDAVCRRFVAENPAAFLDV